MGITISAKGASVKGVEHLKWSGPLNRWQALRDRFLVAISATLRPTAARLLHEPRSGGQGLRHWLRLLVWNGAPLPTQIPDELVRVYLEDPEAMPLHDCADCGLPVPVRPDEDEPDGRAPKWQYFPSCPICGGATGLYARLVNELKCHSAGNASLTDV